MNIFQAKTGLRLHKQVKKYTVIQLFINSMRTRSVRKRFLNFYSPVPLQNEDKQNETKRVS
jgi:hypothetical protein